MVFVRYATQNRSKEWWRTNWIEFDQLKPGHRRCVVMICYSPTLPPPLIKAQSMTIDRSTAQKQELWAQQHAIDPLIVRQTISAGSENEAMDREVDRFHHNSAKHHTVRSFVLFRDAHPNRERSMNDLWKYYIDVENRNNTKSYEVIIEKRARTILNIASRSERRAEWRVCVCVIIRKWMRIAFSGWWA